MDGELKAQTERIPSNPSRIRLAFLSHGLLQQHLAHPRQGGWPQRETHKPPEKGVSRSALPKTECFQVTEHKDTSQKNTVDFISKTVTGLEMFCSWLLACWVSPGRCSRSRFAAAVPGVEAIVAASEAGPGSRPFLLWALEKGGCKPLQPQDGR